VESGARGIDEPGSGWIAFAGAYLLVAGGMNLIWGIVALSNKSAFNETGLVWSTLNTWGWIAIVTGALQMLAGSMVLARRFAGQWLAGVHALVGIFVSFFSAGAYPIWSIIALAANGLVLWGSPHTATSSTDGAPRPPSAPPSPRSSSRRSRSALPAERRTPRSPSRRGP